MEKIRRKPGRPRKTIIKKVDEGQSGDREFDNFKAVYSKIGGIHESTKLLWGKIVSLDFERASEDFAAFLIKEMNEIIQGHKVVVGDRHVIHKYCELLEIKQLLPVHHLVCATLARLIENSSGAPGVEAVLKEDYDLVTLALKMTKQRKKPEEIRVGFQLQSSLLRNEQLQKSVIQLALPKCVRSFRKRIKHSNYDAHFEGLQVFFKNLATVYPRVAFAVIQEPFVEVLKVYLEAEDLEIAAINGETLGALSSIDLYELLNKDFQPIIKRTISILSKLPKNIPILGGKLLRKLVSINDNSLREFLESEGQDFLNNVILIHNDLVAFQILSSICSKPLFLAQMMDPPDLFIFKKLIGQISAFSISGTSDSSLRQKKLLKCTHKILQTTTRAQAEKLISCNLFEAFSKHLVPNSPTLQIVYDIINSFLAKSRMWYEEAENIVSRRIFSVGLQSKLAICAQTMLQNIPRQLNDCYRL